MPGYQNNQTNTYQLKALLIKLASLKHMISSNFADIHPSIFMRFLIKQTHRNRIAPSYEVTSFVS